MSISDALKFEWFNLGNMWDKLKDDPKRAFLGVDPLSTSAWNAVLGRDDKPIVNQLGGPTGSTFREAQAQGIDTGTASTMHGIAQTIAGLYGGYGAANGLINAGAALGSSTGGIVGGGGAPAAVGGATSGAGVGGAIPEVVISASSGGGAAVPAATAGAGAAGTSTDSGFNWKQFLQQGGDMMQQQGAQQQSDEDRVLEQLARRGPPPVQGGTNVGPVPVDQYRAAMTPVAAALG